MTTPDPLFSPLQAKLNRNLLKYAAGHAIFCPACEDIMDARRTVVATIADGRTLVRCAHCWDSIVDKVPDKSALAKLDIVDGRVVFRRAAAGKAAGKATGGSQ
jgi:hypothetical protein